MSLPDVFAVGWGVTKIGDWRLLPSSSKFSSNSIPSARTLTSSIRGVHQVTPDTSVAAALAAMAKEIKELKMSARKYEGTKTEDLTMPLAIHTTRDGDLAGTHLGFNRARTSLVVEMLAQARWADLQRTVGDIAKQLNDNQGGASSASKATVMAVTTPSGRGDESEKSLVDDEEQVDEAIEMDAPRRTHERRVPTNTAPSSEPPVEKKKVEEKSEGKKKIPEVYLSRVPYPARFMQHTFAKDYGRFLELFKQLKFNLPFIEALQHMPKYAKFLKDLLSNNKKLEEDSTVSLSEKCSIVVQNKLPKKLADPSHFMIPCLFGGLTVNHALADIGASINLMPYSIYKQQELVDLKPTRMSISLADRSVKYLRGVVENLIPLIIGRPFWRTANALIDVFEGKIALRVGDENVTFGAMKSVKEPSDQDASSENEEHPSDPEESGIGVPNLEELSDWILDLEELLDALVEEIDDMPEDLHNMMAEFERVVKTPSVGMEENVEAPVDVEPQPEDIPFEIPLPEPLLLIVDTSVEGYT
ncbi:hypothetical protein L1987_39834 [Smallanthus sonchifolius]|uniref:Uncharacterized protein n=1 Tax=Smallanthus sonchifolius TaxID=185202 RepID=A0ACB9GS93_9ASTR|nr:hypothetical protein L1987_39834 [Smallanthus sonchifolius]